MREVLLLVKLLLSKSELIFLRKHLMFILYNLKTEFFLDIILINYTSRNSNKPSQNTI
ncbi:hypothetical protein SAMN05443667_11280 [Flavobacterium gillisiae]|uniref:Uncharacterized protein n=1 Tax=Flavobacterium gillisiae TaxID=150146 RepID=A0A1H4F8L9_9FLAO|nr:hypothetical protein SAMN05443667_11280 [Flavobacterium gillisiae]